MRAIQGYEIIRELGRGGMAEVYLVRKTGANEGYALKRLFRADEFSTPVHEKVYQNIRNRFIAEASKLIGMHHPHLVEVEKYFEKDGDHYILMQYVPGESLQEKLARQGAIGDKEILSLFTQLMEALSYIHQKGYVHRDIKPANILIRNDGRLLLTDFGVAKDLNSDSVDYTTTLIDMKLGTERYMSPEQVKSSSEVDYATDFYSAGVVLWEMVTGKKANDFHPSERSYKIIHEQLPAVSSSFNPIIESLTIKDVQKRKEAIANILRFKIKWTEPTSSASGQGDDRTWVEREKKNSLKNQEQGTTVERKETTFEPKAKPKPKDAPRPQPVETSSNSHQQTNTSEEDYSNIIVALIVALAASLITYFALDWNGWVSVGIFVVVYGWVEKM